MEAIGAGERARDGMTGMGWDCGTVSQPNNGRCCISRKMLGIFVWVDSFGDKKTGTGNKPEVQSGT